MTEVGNNLIVHSRPGGLINPSTENSKQQFTPQDSSEPLTSKSSPGFVDIVGS